METTASHAQKPRSNKAICFRCQFIGIGVGESRCPVCAYPLIVNTSAVALGSSDIERYFARPPSSPPLPGLSEEPRQAPAPRGAPRAPRRQAAREQAPGRDAAAQGLASAHRDRAPGRLVLRRRLLVTLNVLGAL